MKVFGIIFASLGAGMILFALTFVSLLVGGLVNGMAALMSGPLIDRVVDRKKR
jgi:hypothetical protein